MKRLIGSVLAGLSISIILSAIGPGICLISFLSMSGAGGFSQKDCVDLFLPFFWVIFPSMLIVQFIGAIFKIEWIRKIDLFRIIG